MDFKFEVGFVTVFLSVTALGIALVHYGHPWMAITLMFILLAATKVG